MAVQYLPVTQDEFDLVRPHFQQKATALSKSQGKDWAWVGFDASKFRKMIIDDETFIIASGNVLAAVLGDVLPKACRRYPAKFGTRNAYDVLDALYDEEQTGNCKEFEQFLSTEQFALVFKLNQDGTINEKVLRLDLFRMIKPEKHHPAQQEFIGGLLHALKHFIFEGHYLSRNKENYPLNHPSDIIPMVIRGFFLSPHTPGNKYFTSLTALDANKNYNCSFFEEPVIDVYFLNTLHVA